MKYLIIGNGSAGNACANTIAAQDTTAEIILFSNEKEQPYSKIPLSKNCIHFPNLEKISFAQKNNATVVLDTVLSIDVQRKQVQTKTQRFYYDKLGIATGSTPCNPFHTGATYTTYADAKKFHDALSANDRIVIAGGGILGLECAVSFAKYGCCVTVIEKSDSILNQCSSAYTSLLLIQKLIKMGIRILVRTEIKDITSTYIFCSRHEKIRYDHFLVTVGNTPNIQLAFGQLNTRKGIVVNEKMQTSAPDVYAFGDCAEYSGDVCGLQYTAIQQGKIAGLCMCGAEAVYSPSITPIALQSNDFCFGSIGKVTESSYAALNKITGVYQEIFTNQQNICVGGIWLGMPVKNINGLINKPVNDSIFDIFPL